jgi:succinate dehydrogenase flavin-adding protein (antitoxin of CptAB toxin-antitoxin module)
MRELDMLLLAFVENEYAVADSLDQKAFRQLLTLPDPEILALLTGKSMADDSRLQTIVERLLTNQRTD